jgi:hypothetical protein
MELASLASIRALMEGNGNSTRAGRRRGAQDGARSAQDDRGMRCKCGRCRQCVDNARWDRIFAEKFADPNYYSRQAVRYSSPLTSL